MDRILFHIPVLHLPIYGYGMMMVLAFLGCQWLAARLAAARGIDPEIFVNATLIALVAGVVGARLSHVLENLGEYTRHDQTVGQNLWHAVNITSGGLTLYGGIILAGPIVLWYLLTKHVPGRTAADIAAPCIVLGIAVGRIGCFLNGCCYGADTNLPWGVRFPYGSNAYVDQLHDETLKHRPPPGLLIETTDGNRRYATDQEAANDPTMAPLAAANRADPVHPTQLYSTITAGLIMAIVLAYIAGPHVPGRGLALMLILEGPTRFLLEMIRVEPAVWGPMSLSMILGLALFAVGVVLWFALGLYRATPEALATPAPTH